VSGNGTIGSLLNQLRNPWGIYVDTNYAVYVVDRGNHRVVRWDPGSSTGTLVAGETGTAGSWSYLLNLPTSITFDQFGNMYIMDSGNRRVQQWSPGSTFGVTVASSTSLSSPRGIAIDMSGNLLIADYGYHRIVRFSTVCRKYFQNISSHLRS